jgi:serine/threonine-protein kinase HipA
MEIDIHLDGRWRRCAEIAPGDAKLVSRRSPTMLRYDADYALDCLNAKDFRALSVRAPVHLGIRTFPHWPAFLIDLLPQGAARRRLERLEPDRLGEWALLERGATNPVGNLRVRPLTPQVRREHSGFELQEMISRGDAFIQYAYEVGASVAGATDTQGEAPKFWVVQDEHERWHPDDGNLGHIARRYALLKFPVPEAGPQATDILRNEAAYQRVAARLNFRVTQELPAFIDGALLIPRFDRRNVGATESRLGVESLYSVAGIIDSAQTALRHHTALLELRACLTDFDSEILEYIRRDLLNLAMGNRDNHGRNTAILKGVDGTMRLAPLYDFGPSFLDARAIVRTMYWDGETAGATNWNHVLQSLATHFDESEAGPMDLGAVAFCMRAFADELEQLPELMHQCEVDAAIIEMRRPEIGRLAHALRGVGDP